MSVWSWLRGDAKPETKQLNVGGDGWGTSVSGGLGALIALGQAGSEAYSHIYRSQASVYTVVEFLATQVAGVGLKTYRRVSDTDRERLTDEPVSDLLSHPAPGLTYGRLMHQIVADLGVYGNAYLLKLESGDVRSLVPLPPHAVTPMGGNVLAASAYQFQLRSPQPTLYQADEIVHLRRYNPDDARIGVSPLEPLRLVLRSDGAALRHWDYMWRNAARIEGWFQLPEGDLLSDDALSRLRESINLKYTGEENAGKMGILEGGAKVIPSQWSPREAEFISGRQLTLETVARAYNIPLSVLSLTETTTFASAQSFHTQLYVDTLGPWFKTIEEEFEASVVPWITNDPDVYVEFNVEEKLRGCVPAGTLVETPDGPRPIEDIHARDHVFTVVDGDRIEPRMVWAAGQTGVREVYEIKTEGRTLRATANHPVAMLDGSYRPVEELRKGDVIRTLAELPDIGTDLCPTRHVTEGFAEFLGLWLGDGSCEGRNGLSISHHPQASYMPHYRAVMQDEFVAMGSARRGRPVERPFLQSDGVKYRTRMSSREAWEEWDALGLTGLTAHTKQVPQWVFGLSAKLRAAVVRGFLDSDGTVDKRGHISFTSVSEEMATQFRELVMGLGVRVSNIGRYEQVTMLPSGKECLVASSRFSCGDVAANAETIGSWDERYLARWDALRPFKAARRQVPLGADLSALPQGCGAQSISSVELLSAEPVPVFNLTVTDEGHNYIANGVIVHNSFAEQADAYRNSVGVPTMSVNEARALQGLPRIDDPSFDEPVQPANINYAGSPGEAPMPDQRQLRAASATLQDAEILELPSEGRL